MALFKNRMLWLYIFHMSIDLISHILEIIIESSSICISSPNYFKLLSNLVREGFPDE
jgi:hypothetical protein